ncbi:TRAP transporter substrate-binding protein [Planococcus lenghuensis]|uniref:C4-dicarboxylate ABC transporter substrate-binding protein n=1 Tax=Planococcus lenghuensis TaxID=2213202 RepID=A0A1Q2KXL8_9BACL|nr:TRAP transporter substrate-binding protein [Planococcus lenghuensis]AQQ52412.1 C4-dicarboxylate ABC transporter substrate-binding protein [Planococcus lenghuensis]
MKKKMGFVSVMLTGAVALTGCSEEEASGGAEGGEEIYTLQAGHSLPVDHPYQIAFEEMAADIEERTDGQVIIEVFANSEIGAERELVEGLTLGTVDMAVSSTAPITNFVPELEVLDVPFIFQSRDAAVEVLQGEIGDDLAAQMEEQGIILLSWGENGYRHVTNAIRPVETPADLEGLKIRTQENEIHLAAFEALGAQPTPMAWTEALTALQQGVVDAQENPAIVADQFNLYEANQEFMTLTGHVYSVAAFLLSAQTYEELPEDLREIVIEEGQEAGARQRELIIEMEAESLQNLKDQGVQIIEEVDLAPFQEAVQPVYEQIEHEELLNRIIEVQ